MTDETRAINNPETQTQEEAMPTSEQQTTPEMEEAAPQQEVSEPAIGTGDLDLPESAKERTAQQFAKLQEQLRSERARRVKAETNFGYSNQDQESKGLDQYVDPITGTVDVNGLNKVISDTDRRAKRAEEAIGRFERSAQEQQEREALATHPELDPSSKDYREDLYASSRAILMDSMVYPESYGGKTLTLKEAADRAKSLVGSAVKQAKEEGAKEARENLTPKEQASLEATGRSDRRTQLSNDIEILRQQSRRGDLNSIVERMRSVGKQGCAKAQLFNLEY